VELFIYYRVRAERAEELRTAALAMQARLRRELPHLTARLLHGSDTVDGLHTWMETYATDPVHHADAAAPWRERVEAEAACLAPLIEGRRHVEVFTACAS
jgi:Domain of unknown function (DUF4936)